MAILTILQIVWDSLSVLIFFRWLVDRGTIAQKDIELREERGRREIAENQRMILEQQRAAEYKQLLQAEQAKTRTLHPGTK